MVKKLIQHGNSVALVIDKPIMEILNITIETSFELRTDGKNLTLSEVLQILEDQIRNYGGLCLPHLPKPSVYRENKL